MNQELELELTFLSKEIPEEIKKTKPTRVEDIYFPDTPEQSFLRLRRKGNKYELTKKIRIDENDASQHIEQTIQLTREEFISLSKASKKRVAKDRYFVKIDEKDAEIDVFVDDLRGLVLIEFEFKTEKEKENFLPPKSVLADVTQEDFIAGGMLAGKSYEDIEDELRKVNYRKLRK